MTTYYIETMTERDYDKMMRGEFSYYVKTLTIEAETKAEAIAKVKATGAERVNEECVKTAEDIKAEELNRAEMAETDRVKREAIKAKRAENEKARATAEDLTVTEYRARKNAEARVKRCETEVKRLEKELEYAKRKLAEAMKEM